MKEKEYCLLYEPWLRVVDFDCNIHEVSLIQLFEDAHKYKDLCGELPTQDFAVLRLLLAILHTVFSRYDLNGNIAPFKDIDDALDRWEELWKNGKFPIKVIADYLETQKESFWLFHPERPFYQVAAVGKMGKVKNSDYNAEKFNGELLKSGHKDRLFASLSGKERESVSYSQAARWLINLNAFDDNAVKDGAGIGWLGDLGLITLEGNNLFETLMLNFVIYNTNNNELWGDEKPIWESKDNNLTVKKQIVFPDNLSELYTLQSRRSFLFRKDSRVIGYRIRGGDYFDAQSAIYEPMTLWKQKKGTVDFVPKRHDSATQFWRDFSSIFSENKMEKCPGLISWFNVLEENKESDSIERLNMLKLKIAAVVYDKGQRSSIENNFSDSLQIHASLISDMNKQWRKMVLNSVEFCDTIARKVWTLAEEINLPEGGDYVEKDNAGSSIVAANKAKADFYNRIDAPFRKWLCTLDPKLDDAENKQKEWRHECVKIAKDLGNEIISHIDMEAIFGRTKNLKENTKHNYSAASAMNKFLGGLYDAENK